MKIYRKKKGRRTNGRTVRKHVRTMKSKATGIRCCTDKPTTIKPTSCSFQWSAEAISWILERCPTPTYQLPALPAHPNPPHPPPLLAPRSPQLCLAVCYRRKNSQPTFYLLFQLYSFRVCVLVLVVVMSLVLVCGCSLRINLIITCAQE